ncbi:cell division protein FtsW [Bacillus sp. RG28]|uniref:Probable peptidoglycan glycosyltransferase FtsW n=1 Tax=Gottfriedia endophytica TaxID=2820819 RepID=A0A940SK09_9BACI|nr:putative peptidoglycan glycosyltransferase FtsW [Gottfriedia endophytica]MBP0724773.1 cell division protein FtsW [Gottfriedia endophytica]
MLKKYIKNMDYMLFVPLLILCTFGLVMVYSASSALPSIRYQNMHWSSDHFFVSQLHALELGIIAFIILLFVPTWVYKKNIILISNVAISIGLLVAVLLFGKVVNNAKSWIFGIQPAEIIKLSTILFLAGWYAKNQKSVTTNLKTVLKPLIVIGIYCFLLKKQPDTGTMMLLLGTTFTIVFCCGYKVRRFIVMLLGGGIILSPVILLFVFNPTLIITKVQLNRFLAYKNPFDYAQGIGFQLVNSLVGFAHGGLTGVGLGKGIQKLGYLPEPHTDFILAVIGEETGLIGVLIVITCIFLIVWRGILIAHKSKDALDSLIAIGVTASIAIQSFVNIGGVTSLIPLTGVPLPFVSYGGTSLIVMISMMGILMQIAIRVKLEEPSKESKLNVVS